MIGLARPYLYLLPTLAVLATFTYFPIYRLGAMSLRAPGFGTAPGPWVGLSAYAQLFHAPLFWRVVGQTCVYVFSSVPITMALALGLALLLNEPIRGKGVFRVLYYTPVVMPTVAVAALALWMFNANAGVIDYLLARVGLSPVPWLVRSDWALPTLILIAIWKNLGYYMIIYLAGLQGLPPAVLDAARLDGARTVVRFFTITLPLLRPTTFFLAVVALIGSFQVFDFVNLMTQGGPSNASNVLVYFAYQNGFGYLQLGVAAAISLVMFVLVLAILAVVAWVLNR
ncbi:MAG: sugar ABC transporter permease [Candidatus Eremiobacteraeota bacterium]|nr:sugar ABC transporter permease [Candidatus Eremiobacteraeota bacterium]MBV8354376.1 sugar ABC transporter permease [Candidatus Eremiobacteraeota bacterium]